MSDTGSTKFPEGPRLAGSAARNTNETVLSARLIGVPNATKGSEDKVIKLQGQVIDQNDQGRVRVQTGKGIVEIQLPKDAPQGREPLKRGQRVEINIPPEKVRKRNPESIQIKAEIPPEVAAKAQLKAQRVENQNTQETLATRPAKGQTEQPRTQTQSVDERLSPAPRTTQETAKQAVQNAKLGANLTQQLRDILPPKETLIKALPIKSLEGETIRLTPLPPNLASQIIVPDVTTIPTSVTPQPAPLQNIVIPNAVIENATPHTSITSKAPNDAPQKTISNQIIIANFENTGITIITPQTQLAAQSTNTIQNINFNAQPIEFTQNTKPLDTFITFEPLKTLPTIQRAITIAPITASIQTIKPPELVLNAPTTDTKQNIQQNILLNGSPDNTKTATIIGSAGRQLPIVQIPSTIADGFSQNFILQAPVQDAVIGTRLEITPQNTMQSGAQVSATNTFSLALPPASYFLTPDQWPLMEDILQSIRSASPQAAQAFTSIMPNATSTPSQMGPAALFIMAALRGGDLSNILSEKAQEILRGQGKGHLISRLTQEGGLINRLSADTPSTDWRSLTLPMAWENEIHKVALHYKHDYPDGEEDDKGGKQTRFIFDLSLSRMGKVQIDGLHKQNRLNLIIRTEQPLSRAMQITMKDGYINALGETSLSGDLSFQNNLDSWVKISAKGEDHFATDI